MHRLLSWPSLCVCACAVCSLRLLKESPKRAAHLYLFRKSRWWREKEWEGERKCSIAQASFIFSRGHTINVSHRDGNSKATREIERKRERAVFSLFEWIADWEWGMLWYRPLHRLNRDLGFHALILTFSESIWRATERVRKKTPRS